MLWETQLNLFFFLQHMLRVSFSPGHDQFDVMTGFHLLDGAPRKTAAAGEMTTAPVVNFDKPCYCIYTYIYI